MGGFLPRDEFDSYVPVICGWILEGVDDHVLVQRLRELALDWFDQSSFVEDDLALARELIELRERT